MTSLGTQCGFVRPNVSSLVSPIWPCVVSKYDLVLCLSNVTLLCGWSNVTSPPPAYSQMLRCAPAGGLPVPGDCGTGLPFTPDPWTVRHHRHRSTHQTEHLIRQISDAICGLTSDAGRPERTAQEGESGASYWQHPDAGAMDPWPKDCRPAYIEFCTLHLSANALKVMCFLYRVEVQPKSDSTVLAKALFVLKAPPIWVDVLRNWYARYRVVRCGGNDPGLEFVAPSEDPSQSGDDCKLPAEKGAGDEAAADGAGSTREEELRAAATTSRARRPRDRSGSPPAAWSRSSGSRSRSPDHASPSPSPARSRSRARSGSKSGGGSGTGSGVPGVDTQSLKYLAKVFALALNKKQRRCESDDDLVSGLCKTEEHERKMQKLVDHRQLLSLVKLGSAYMAKIRDSTGASTRIKLGDGLWLSGKETTAEEGYEASAVQIREGWDTYVRLHRESKRSSIRKLANDRALFGERVWQLQLGNFAEKANFLKEFMFLYYKEDAWVPLIHTNVVLIMSTLCKKAKAPDAVSAKKADPRPAGRTEGGRKNGTPKKNGDAGRDGHRRSSLFCHSRVDPGAKCEYGKSCKFDHNCASCGGRHAAVDCPNAFDKKKAQAAAASRKAGN